MSLLLSRLGSPLGEMLLVTDAQCNIRALHFADHEARLHRSLREHYGRTVELTSAPAPREFVSAFASYFIGTLGALDALSTATEGSDLQLRVWRALRETPAGTTTTYGKLARGLGLADPRAAIDIGAACAANPIAIVVPCHRVVATDGSFKGYAWGLHRKRWLLEHEKIIPEPGKETAARLPGF